MFAITRKNHKIINLGETQKCFHSRAFDTARELKMYLLGIPDL